jgi:alpha-beta hydrolase superfamily lysophospholipase
MIDSVGELISTSEDFLMYVQRKYPKLPIYLSGLSLGGLMAYYVSLRKHVHVAGTILHNPAFTDNPLNNSLGKRLIGTFGKVLPPMKLTTSLRNRSTSYSLSEYKKNDKHMYSGRIWSTTVCSLLAEMGQSISTFEKFTLPYLCIQGGTDKIVNPFIVFQLE